MIAGKTLEGRVNNFVRIFPEMVESLCSDLGVKDIQEALKSFPEQVECWLDERGYEDGPWGLSSLTMS